MIMKGRATLRLPWAGLLTLAVLAAASLPAWASGGRQSQAQPPQPSQQAQPRQQPQPAQVPQQHQQAQPAHAPQQHPQPQPMHPQQSPTPAVQQATPVTHPTPQPTPSPGQPLRVSPAHGQQGQPTPKPTPAGQQGQQGQQGQGQQGQQGQRQLRVQGLQGQQGRYLVTVDSSTLPEAGQKLVQGFEKDREAIQREADLKMEARRAAFVKELEALQEQYTKAGKLDEAIAIRDYIKSGGPSRTGWIIRGK